MVDFNLTFKTDRYGFTPSKTQQAAIELAARNWGKVFDHDVTIDLLVESVNDPNSDTLMSAGTNYPIDLTAGFENNEVVRTKVLTGVDTNGSEYDGGIEVNWGIDWELDINETPDVRIIDREEYDFYSTFYHEISHALGFLSLISRDGTDLDGGGVATTGVWGFFDQFVADGRGNPLIDGSSLRIDASKYTTLLQGGSSADGSSGLFFNGPKAVAANNNNPVGLFTPAKFSEGSSGSHLDDENPSLQGFLMLAESDYGPNARILHPIERAIFEDLGYRLVDITPILKSGKNPAYLAIDSLGIANTIQLRLDTVGIASTSEIRILSIDDADESRTQIATFSILDSDRLAAGYAPSLVLDDRDISKGDSLLFEIIEDGESRFATIGTTNNHEVVLDFGQGTLFNIDTAFDNATSNLLLDDADGIDLSGQTGFVTVEMNVYREADLNNTVGFYRADDADGSIVDPITGTILRPGDAGYTEAALERQLNTQLTGANGLATSFSAQWEAGGHLGMFLVADGGDPAIDEIFFSYSAANANGNDHVKQFGSNIFGFEDLTGLGDRDYNDVVVQFSGSVL